MDSSDLDFLRSRECGGDGLACRIRSGLLPLGLHRCLDLVAPVHAAACELIGHVVLMHEEQ
jgi:hypothetical protein